MFAAGRYAVVGAEVAGSASPAMQNAALEAVGMQPSYEAHSLTAAELPLYLRRASAEGFRGLNFTAPFKTVACTAAKVCSSVVQATGAANTWRIGPRGAEAFNTDTDGIWAMLTAYGALSAGQRVVLLGAGGAARAAAFVLGQWADAVLVINRTPAHARALCASQTLHPENRARWQVLQLQHPGDVSALQEAFADAALVIDAVGNRTAARATGHESRLPWRALDHRAELFDLSYASAPSPLSLWTGRAAFDGATMLLHQGAASFELWTGREAPLEVMRDALAGRLGRPASSIPMVPGAIGRWEHAGSLG
jgi:shikimate dehydrogenase